MTVVQGIVLGILQGAAEFLPISSSGHLRVVQHIFNLDDVPLLFDITLHMATLAAVVVYFRRIIGRLLAVLFRWIFRRAEPQQPFNVSIVNHPDERTQPLAPNDEIGRRTIVAMIVTTAVTGVLGIGASKLIPDLPLKFVAGGFIVTAALLVVSAALTRRREVPEQDGIRDDFYRDRNEGISWKQALIIGVAQGIGTLPGISRSGSTIAGAQLCRVPRRAAGDYSFVVSIPAIVGAFILELRHLDKIDGAVGLVPLIAGCAAAFVAGYAALALFMRIIRKGRLELFALYLVPLGIAGLIFF